MAVVTVLGAGMMGSALCIPLADRGHEVRLVGTHLDGEIVESLKARQPHPKLRLALPPAVRPCFVEELDEALDGAEILALGVNSHGVDWAAERLSAVARQALPVILVSKGVRWDGRAFRLLTEIVGTALAESLGEAVHPVAITGPCIAGELALRVDSCVVFSGRDPATNQRLAGELRTPYYRVWTSSDPVGHELCAALKNAYAMGIAFATGLHERHGGTPGSIALHNCESAVFAQASREMRTLVGAAGGDPDVVTGLSGVGDLDVTTNGGRTGRFGRLLGLGLPVEEAVEAMQGDTLECLDVLRVIRAALPALEEQGRVAPETLPLVRHMAAVALDGQAVELPLDRFFGA